MSQELVKKLSEADFKKTIESGVTLVDFSAEWCTPCKMLVPVLEEVAAQNKDSVTLYKIDIEQAQEATSEFQVTSVPTLILFKDGKEMNRIVGSHDAEAIQEFIKESLS